MSSNTSQTDTETTFSYPSQGYAFEESGSMFGDPEENMRTTTLIRFARPEAADRPTYSTIPTTRRSTAKTFVKAEPSRIEKRRQRTRTFAEDPFRARFGVRLPSGMREEARGMEWKKFIQTYAPSTVRVEYLRSERLRAGRHEFHMSMTGLRADGQGTAVDITAMGACSAISEVLADHAMPVEILEFHQLEIFEATVTFIYTVHKSQRAWAIGFGADRDLSIANALCAAAGKLHRS
ncbi:hypothetical protein ACUY3S_02005 [Corynebacterium resistens]